MTKKACRNYAKNVFFQGLSTNSTHDINMAIPRCRQSDLGRQVKVTFTSPLRHGPSHVGDPKVHSTGDKNEHGGGGHKQISHNEFRRFQIQGFHIELSGFWLTISKIRLCKCRTTMTFHDHMWKLPWKKKTSFTTMTTYSVPAANSRFPCCKTSFLLIWKLYNKFVHAVNPRYAVHATLLGSHNFIELVHLKVPMRQNFIPKNWVAVCCSPGFPGLHFPGKWLGCGSRPRQRVCEVVTPPAPTRTTQQRGLLSFISEQLAIIQTNLCDGLVGFEGGSKSLSVLKTAAWETYTSRRTCPS